MSRSERRVVVTGMGIMSALGNDVQATWDGLVAGRSACPDRLVRARSGSTSQIAGEVGDFDASHVLDRKELRRTDRYTSSGLVAAREAMDQAGLPERPRGRPGRATGSSWAPGWAA
jgi:3-oxoacyl-[acyl-carrier-protein] synthase II